MYCPSMTRVVSFCSFLSATLLVIGLTAKAGAAMSYLDHVPMAILLSFPTTLLIVSLLLGLIACAGFSLFKSAHALHQLDGPRSSSLLLGHLQLFFDPIKGMTTQNELLSTYGSVCKLKGVLGADQLWVSDPRAMHEILVKSHQQFLQPGSVTTWMELLIGPNVLTAIGHKHKTQRKILNPAFTATHMRNRFLIILVTPTIATVCHKLQEIIKLKIQCQGENTGVVDMFKWLNVAALEMMGQAGFGYSFDALKPDAEEVAYLNASHDIRMLIFKLWYITPILPWLVRIGSARFRRAIVQFLPLSSIQALRNAVDILSVVAVKIYHLKKEESDKLKLDSDGQCGRDVMSSLLLQNNMVAPQEAMDEEEIISEVNALILAAHESTSAALARVIQVLAEHPDIQSKLRNEIREAHDAYGEELSYDQLNSLSYLDAVCRESLRLYAPAPFLIRVAQEDWTIPLLYPGKSSSGEETITQVPVKKGSFIYLSLDGANRDKRTWGEDSNVFRPSRWMDPAPLSLQASRMPGIYSSLMTFSGGPRACMVRHLLQWLQVFAVGNEIITCKVGLILQI
ncbi:unnamed protein product [Rhizoctonia solani]|uniref:Cytochrome P450 family protein n=1 Tax=Rhizoctonia solani TaxID=456999 RepID=A0A8H3GPE3_9AGAM|nr:unnamed protein product [Rhizoctonia solani]